MYEILIVEDFSSLTQILDISLKQAGFNMHEARTADQAIASAENNNFDLILCDADIENCDPIELIGQLSQLTGKEHSSLIAFSKEKGTAKKQNALDAGADRWIEKPFDVDDLVNDVLAVIH